MIWTQKFWIFTIFLAVLPDGGAINVKIRQRQYEELTGSSVTLHCNFQPKVTNPVVVNISWSAVGTQPGDQEDLIITHFYPFDHTDIKSQYIGRVAMNVNVWRGTADLRLSSLTVADDKIYQCRVLIRDDEEGKQADTTRLVVNEPVSKPICGIQGTVRIGENINLTCHSVEGSPPPSYTWEKWEQEMGFRRLFMEPTATQHGGVLSLYDIGRQTSGLYTCTSTNKVRASVCKVNLTVSQEPVVFGAIAGVAAGVLTSIASAAGGVLLSDLNNDGEQTPVKSP